MPTNKKKHYILFSYLLNVPPIFKKSLYDFFDFDIEKCAKCKKEDLIRFADIYPNITIPRNFLAQKEKLQNEILYSKIIESEKFITFEDGIYPPLLKEIEDAPLLLYYRGELNFTIFENTLAVVGSRNASESAKSALSNIISNMKNLPITIVSGLAYGIDATAHKSAIANNLKTIGVIGSGLNFTYPGSNKDLYEKIEKDAGVIFSEYPPDIAPMAQNFPQRNRIITGLSKGTLVAEATLKSGALISANLTLEQNRELMCMPGLISNPNTQGIYKLIKDGAPIITNADDIFEILNWNFKTEKGEIELNHQEKIIFDIISLEPATFEKIQAKTEEISVSDLMVILTGLELRGLIKQINGKYLLG